MVYTGRFDCIKEFNLSKGFPLRSTGAIVLYNLKTT